MSKPLSSALERARDHILAANGRGLTLKAYAAEQGLSAAQLYGAKAKLKRKGALPRHEPAFARVRVAGIGKADTTLTIRLPNGIAVEVPEGAGGATVCAVLDALLARS